MPSPNSTEPIYTVARSEGDHLGEGTAWDAGSGTLIWVDISGGIVHRWHLASDLQDCLSIAGEVSAAVPREDGGLVLAVGHELLIGDPKNGWQRLASVEVGLVNNRFNDCRCDPEGRLWAGTMSKSRDPGAGCLYRITTDGEVMKMLDGTTISNGLGWSTSGERMYFVDSLTQRIDVFDFDQTLGTIEGRRTFAMIPPTSGLPDGIAVDAEDGVWVALFGGGAVHRYAADGELDEVVGLPVSNPTCPAFAGATLDRLFVTSARHRLSPSEVDAQPLAGALFELHPKVKGRATYSFRG